MCSGRVDLKFILKAFFNGSDGVLIIGCRLGECNYVTQGNFHALNMAKLCKKIIEHVGLNPERLSINFMSSAEGILFARTVTDFSNKIKELGPLGEQEGIDNNELKTKLAEVIKLVPYIKVAEREKLSLVYDKDELEKYDQLYTNEDIENLFANVPSYYIDPEKCQACGTCRRRCPAEAITGDKGLVHVIDQDKCIKCGTCFEFCPPRFGAVTKIVGEPVPPPPPEDKRKIKKKAKKQS